MRKLLVFMVLAVSCFGQVAVSPMLNPHVQFLDAAGNPLSGGKIYTYTAGTTTPRATYSESTGVSANTNPVVLDSGGWANIWMGPYSYKFVAKDSSDVTIWTVDGVSSLNKLVTDSFASFTGSTHTWTLAQTDSASARLQRGIRCEWIVNSAELQRHS
jgi:hypothetical protein